MPFGHGLNAAISQGAQFAQRPTGIAALLADPALQQALLGTGTALLAQSDRPGTLGGALGRALPVGLQAFQQTRSGQADQARQQEFEELLTGMPETQARVFRLMGVDGGGLGALAKTLAPEPSDPFSLSPGQVRFDGEGNVIAENVPEPEAPKLEFRQFGNQVAGFDAEGNVVSQFEFNPEKDFGDVASLRGEFDKAVSPFDDAVEAFVQLEATGSTENPTAQDDIALVFQFMKSVDPTSSVREGEFATASNAGGIDARIRNLFNSTLNGERLTPEQRANLISTARTAIEARIPLYEQHVEFFGNIADSSGIDRAQVIRNPFATLERAVSGAPDPETVLGQYNVTPVRRR